MDLQSEAGNGMRNGLKSVLDWAISSQAANGAANSGRLVEGSTTRIVSANNNRSHECPTTEAVDDIVSALIERQRVWIKSQTAKNTEG